MRPQVQDDGRNATWQQVFALLQHSSLLPTIAAMFCLMLIFLSFAKGIGQEMTPYILFPLVCLSMVTVARVLRVAWLTRNHRQIPFVMQPNRHHVVPQRSFARAFQMMSGQLSEIDAARLRLLMTDRDFTAEDYEVLRVLDEENPTFRAASSADIARLPTRILKASDISKLTKDNRTCAVCLGNYVEGDELRTLTCLHHFHKDCVDSWLHRNAVCPVCKFPALG